MLQWMDQTRMFEIWLTWSLLLLSHNYKAVVLDFVCQVASVTFALIPPLIRLQDQLVTKVELVPESWMDPAGPSRTEQSSFPIS
jgi:hypothetical protein